MDTHVTDLAGHVKSFEALGPQYQAHIKGPAGDMVQTTHTDLHGSMVKGHRMVADYVDRKRQGGVKLDAGTEQARQTVQQQYGGGAKLNPGISV